GFPAAAPPTLVPGTACCASLLRIGLSFPFSAGHAFREIGVRLWCLRRAPGKRRPGWPLQLRVERPHEAAPTDAFHQPSGIGFRGGPYVGEAHRHPPTSVALLPEGV